MKSSTILVVGPESHDELLDSLFDAGLLPVVRATMQSAIDIVSHERLAGIVLDSNHNEVDALELVLNIRDIDQETPIFVVGCKGSHQYEVALAKLSNTFLFDSVNGIKAITRNLKGS